MQLRRKTAVALLMIILALTLIGCTDLNSGTVTEKKYQPEEDIYSPIPMYTGKTLIIMPRWIHRPARYILYIENGEEHSVWYVSQETYDSVEIGDYIER